MFGAGVLGTSQVEGGLESARRLSVSACARSGKGPGTDASWRRRATMARLVSPRVWGGGLVTAACLKLTVDEARWPRVAALRARAKDWTRYWARAHLRFYCLVQPPFSHTSRMPGRVLSAIYPSPGLRIGSRSARPQTLSDSEKVRQRVCRLCLGPSLVPAATAPPGPVVPKAQHPLYGVSAPRRRQPKGW